MMKNSAKENEIEYEIENFSGPLDLLLHLISVHKLNINDINIFELVEQYTAYVKKMQSENIELASEFIEMASRLVYIKTVSLLPKYEDAERLRQELTGELIEYRDCKIIAEKLGESTDGFKKQTRQMQKIKADLTYTKSHDPLELLESYLNAAGKRLSRIPPKQENFKEIVQRAIVSVSVKINGIISSLRTLGRVKLDEIYLSARSRSELVASFLAILEMTRKGVVTLDGENEKMTVSINGDADFDKLTTEFEG